MQLKRGDSIKMVERGVSPGNLRGRHRPGSWDNFTRGKVYAVVEANSDGITVLNDFGVLQGIGIWAGMREIQKVSKPGIKRNLPAWF